MLQVRRGEPVQISYCQLVTTGIQENDESRVINCSQIMESRRRGQDPDAGLGAPEQAAHLHTQHVQRHCGEVGGGGHDGPDDI